MQQQQMITIPKKEYEALKTKANLDLDVLRDFVTAFLDIKQGRVRRVK